MERLIPGGPGPTFPPLGRFAFVSAVFVAFLLCQMPLPVSAQTPRSPILQVKFEAAADILRHEKALRGLSDGQRHDIIRFIGGNLLFVFLHEMGHVLITEMGLPVLGREEDAADAYASVTMIRMQSMFSDDVLAQAAQGWFYSDRRDRMEHVPVVYYDAHSLSQQRAYQIVCYLVGSDPQKFAHLAEETNLPEERRQSCRGDFSNADWSWNRLLKSHWRTTQPRTEIRVQYEDPGERFEMYARAMKDTQLLETLAQRFSDTFVWRAPFTIEARSCGSAAADWNLVTRTVTICYEMAADFASLYSSYNAAALTSWR